MAYVKNVYEGKYGVVRKHEDFHFEVLEKDTMQHYAYVFNKQMACEMADNLPNMFTDKVEKPAKP